MKLLSFFTALFIVIGSASAQKYKFEQKFGLDDVEYLKNAKVYLGLTDNEEHNQALRTALEKEWDFTEIAGEASIESLKERISKKEKIAFITVGQVSSSNLFSDKSGVNAKSKSFAVQLNTNGGRYGIYNQHVCFSDGFLDSPEKSISTGVKILNSKIKTIYSEKLKDNFKLKDYAISQKDVFEKKTLYIPKNWLEDISEDDFKAGYSKKVQFVDFETFYSIIENEQEDAIYVLPIAAPAEGGFVNTHIFIEAKGHKYLGLCQRLTAGELSTNVFNSYSGTIEKRHIKLYENTANGKW